MADDLRTLPADPRAIRAEVLRRVLERADADSAVVYGVSESDGGVLEVPWWMHAGHDSIDAAMSELASDPGLRPGWSTRLFVRPPAAHLRGFVELDRLIEPQLLESTTFYRRFFQDQGIRDQIRFLAFEGPQFIAFVGAFRRGGPRFGRADRRRLSPLVDDIRAALSTANCLEQQHMPRESCHLILQPDGACEYATPSAVRWLETPRIAAALSRAVGDLDRGRTSWFFNLGAARIDVVRLDGTPLRYLATVAPASPLRMSPAAPLSAKELEVAELAAAGSTVDEIARALDRKTNTIRTQLREAYRKLGVSNRVELRAILRGSGSDE